MNPISIDLTTNVANEKPESYGKGFQKDIRSSMAAGAKWVGTKKRLPIRK
jgi:hypothetical protein